MLILSCCAGAQSSAQEGVDVDVIGPETYEPPDFPFLEGETPGSVSIGDVTEGRLVYGRPVELPGRGHTLLPRHARRGLHYGTDELVDMIEFVGYRLRRRRGSLLRVGNLAARHGGDITYSVSHNSGRDVDFAFCYQNAKGKRVRVSDFIALDAKGKSRKHGGKYRFDAACTWTIVTAVLGHKGTQVQYIFIANPLRAMLLDYARSSGANARIVTRAAAVLYQPGRRTHDDHLHVRIYCSEEDVGLGCVNTGVEHAWIDVFPERRGEAMRALVAHTEHADPEQRARAVERLVLLHGAEFLDAVLRLLRDPQARPRAAAAVAVRELGGPNEVAALAAAFSQEEDPTVRRALFGAAIALGGPDATQLLLEVVGADQVEEDLRIEAFAHAGRSGNTKLAPTLHRWVVAQPPTLREPAEAALRRLSNRSFPAPDAWEAWLAQQESASHEQWVLDGFQQAGFDVPALDKKHVWGLVPALLGPDHIAFNARRSLERITGHQPRPRVPAELCEHWVDWLDRRVRRLRLRRTPRGLRRSCAETPVREIPRPAQSGGGAVAPGQR